MTKIPQANNMKVIFLDYDGVLNIIDPPRHISKHKGIDGVLVMAEEELVRRLNLIVDRTGAELVLSSSWRHLKEWEKCMRLSGIFKKFIGTTPRHVDHKKFGVGHDSLVRGHNIQEWLDEHPEVEDYVILDDSADFLPHQESHLFRTKTAEGLTQEVADKVEAYLLAND